jgi:hypothetical protein
MIRRATVGPKMAWPAGPREQAWILLDAVVA